MLVMTSSSSNLAWPILQSQMFDEPVAVVHLHRRGDDRLAADRAATSTTGPSRPVPLDPVLTATVVP